MAHKQSVGGRTGYPELLPFANSARHALLQGSAPRLASSGTLFKLPKEIKWRPQPGFPANSLDTALLEGSQEFPGFYLTLVRWHPGYMGAPHKYIRDRNCVVISGVWWINSGPAFEPNHCVPVGPGGFIKRLAHTSHYDGVLADGIEPAIVAICGLAPVGARLVDPTRPGWRRV